MRKIGVFLCDCNRSLDRSIALAALSRELLRESDVIRACKHRFLCSPLELGEMVRTVKDECLDAVVVGACEPEFVESDIKNALRAVGLNPEIAVVVNLRGFKGWPGATGRAKRELMRALAWARYQEPFDRASIPVQKKALVIGAGIAGIETSLRLAEMGVEVVVVEQGTSVGGLLQKAPRLYLYEESAGEFLNLRRLALSEASNVRILTGSKLERISGQVGNFVAEVTNESGKERFDVGAVVVATGGKFEFPAETGLRPGPNIVGQSRFDSMVRTGTPSFESVTFVLDIGGDTSRLGTVAALNGAIAAKDAWGSEVNVLCKNLKIDGAQLEALYREAREAGVIFFKFADKPEIAEEGEHVKVKFIDQLLGQEEIELKSELVVVEERYSPWEGFNELQALLGITQPENVFLYPVRSNRKGIFYAGGCRGELELREVLEDASEVAAEIVQMLGSGRLEYDTGRVAVDPSKCALCLTCIRTCPHKAIEVDPEKRAAVIVEVACEACGVCVAECPGKAIQMRGYSDAQFLAELDAYAAGN